MSTDTEIPAITPRRILVVDDNVDGAESLSMLLELDGHTTFVCHDGLAALELAEKERPDVAILDIGLPGMNGYLVATQLRAQPWGRAMKLIALTGWAQEKDRLRAIESGLIFTPRSPSKFRPSRIF